MGHLIGPVDASYRVEVDKTGRAKCRQCRKSLEKNKFRMCKLAHNWFDNTPSSTIYHFYHIPCLFEGLKRCRTTTRVIDSKDEIANFENIPQDLQSQIENLIVELKSHRVTKKPTVPKKENADAMKQAPIIATTRKPYKGVQLVVLHSNADVFTAEKKTELLQLIQLHKPHIVTVSEINPNGRCFLKQDYEFPEFRMYPCNVGSPGCRGIATYVHSSIVESVTEVEVDKAVRENVWLSLKLRTGDNLLFGNVYRSPNSSVENNSLINQTIRSLCQNRAKYSHQCIVGDMNLHINWKQPHLTQPDSDESKFLETTQDLFLFQRVEGETRCRGDDQPSLLDVVLTNEEDMVSRVEHLAPLGKSDHQTLLFRYNCYADFAKPTTRYNYNKADFESAREELIQNPIQLTGDVESMWQQLKSRLHGIRDRFVPLIKVNTSRWKADFPHDGQVIDLIKEKGRLHRQWMANKFGDAGALNRKKYNRARNQVRKRTRQLKRKH